LERAVLQKPSRGTVEITAARESDHLLIKICDDGYGSESGDAMFAAGYSTAPFLTEFSGRGIGLDAVLDSVERANGTIETKSKPGHGTSFEVKLPLENK
jgi:two-component system chemotaxis sensor kinase CheA